jgi:hypothetical protein
MVLNILKGKTTMAEVGWRYDRTPGEIERWMDQGISGWRTSSRPRLHGSCEQYDRKLSEAHAGLGDKKQVLKALK